MEGAQIPSWRDPPAWDSGGPVWSPGSLWRPPWEDTAGCSVKLGSCVCVTDFAVYSLGALAGSYFRSDYLKETELRQYRLSKNTIPFPMPTLLLPHSISFA